MDTDEMIDAYINSIIQVMPILLKAGLKRPTGSADFTGFQSDQPFRRIHVRKKSSASKSHSLHLVQQLIKWNFKLVDCQVTTAHLKSFGAQEIPRSDFMIMLKSALHAPTKKGKWKLENKSDIPQKSLLKKS
jgi:hypothetical protein